MSNYLIRFRVSNFRSIRDQVELTTVASKPAAKPHQNKSRFFDLEAVGEPVSAVTAVYGANASGKTSLFQALAFMKYAVQHSYRWLPDEAIPVELFAGHTTVTSSEFIVDLAIGGIRYEYGFAADRERITSEWAYAWPHGKKQTWFERREKGIKFGSYLTGQNRTIEELTRPNALFLSVAAQNNHEQLKPLYDWFDRRLRGYGPAMRGGLNNTSFWWQQFVSNKATSQLRKRVVELLRAADVGVTDFRVREVELPPAEQEELTKLFASLGAGHALPKLPRSRIELEFKHGDFWLQRHQQSTGTSQLLALMPVILETLAEGGIIVIDELSAMHPTLARELLLLFQDFKHNPNHAQLLFNTHDTSLLGTSHGEDPPLSRDQIWFTEKDKHGVTSLVSLFDYHPRDNENLERGYLQGRYGAVPYTEFGKLTQPKSA